MIHWSSVLLPEEQKRKLFITNYTFILMGTSIFTGKCLQIYTCLCWKIVDTRVNCIEILLLMGLLEFLQLDSSIFVVLILHINVANSLLVQR